MDRKKLKENIKKYVDEEICIEDYLIKINEEFDENGDIEKYRIRLENIDTEQSVCFVLDYDIDASYGKELFEDDLYKKISHTMKKMEEMNAYNCIRNGRYTTLNIGDRFGFGNYNGMPIRWRVINREDNKIMAITDEIICKREYHHNTLTNKWSECDLRNWLNEEFFATAFDAGEKELIVTTKVITSGCDETKDKVFLLSNEEVDLIFKQSGLSLRTSSWWWLRTPGGNNTHAGVVLVGNSSEEINSNVDNKDGAVCPVIWIKY